jgi:chromosome segregation ATPase
MKSLQVLPSNAKTSQGKCCKHGCCSAVLEHNSDKQTLEKSLLESQAKLHNSQQQVALLESALSEKVATCSELSVSLQEAEMKEEEYLSQLAEQKAQYQSLYKELHLERQQALCANSKKGNLELQVSLLRAAALSQSHELKNMSVKAQKAIDLLLQLENKNSTLKNKLSQCVTNLQTEIQHCQNKLHAV